MNDNVKRALMFGSIGVGAVLFLTGRRPIGAVVAGVGLAMLAAEHPDKVDDLWQNAPEYLERGNRMLNDVVNFIDRLGEQGARLGGQQRTGTGYSG